MDISLIGANAGSVWNALHENGELDLTKLKKETKLSETEILAAIGWLAREGKILSVETKKGRRTVVLFLRDTLLLSIRIKYFLSQLPEVLVYFLHGKFFQLPVLL